MEKHYELIFDQVMIKQLRKAAKNNQIKHIISRMLDKLESMGPNAGKLLDSKLHLYEVKNMNPPIRLYFKHKEGEIYIFEFEIKKSAKKQEETINKLRLKS